MKWSSWFVALCGFLLMTTGTSAAPPPWEAKKTKAREGIRSFTGVLEEGDAKDKAGKPFKVIPLPMVKGSAYRVELKSAAFAPILRLETSKGAELARLDKATDKGILGLELLVPADDEYQFFISSADDRTGGYNLTLFPLGRPGDAGIQLLEDRLKTGERKTHPLKAGKGRRYIIDLYFLDDVKSVGLTGERDKKELKGTSGTFEKEPRRARLEFPSEAEGLVTLSVQAEGEGRYLLRIKEEKVLGELLDVAGEGSTLEEELTVLDPPDKKRKGCFCKVYKVPLQEGLRYEIRMRSDVFDTFLRLEDAKGKEMAWDDDGDDGTNSRIVFLCKAGGVYQIVATSFNSSQGAFVLTVQELKKEK